MFNTLKSQKGLSTVIIILIAIGIVVITGGIYWWQRSSSVPAPTPTPISAPTPFKCQLTPTKNNIIVSGKVNFPKGIKDTSKYEIVVSPDSYKISQDGEFCAEVPKGVFVVGVSSDNEDDFPLLSVIVSEKDKNIVIDSKSTAVGLLFVTPFFSNNDPVEAAKIIKYIEENPKTAILASRIAEKENLSASDIGEGPITEAFKDALETIISSQFKKTD